jgi:hypothetical protein
LGRIVGGRVDGDGVRQGNVARLDLDFQPVVVNFSQAEEFGHQPGYAHLVGERNRRPSPPHKNRDTVRGGVIAVFPPRQVLHEQGIVGLAGQVAILVEARDDAAEADALVQKGRNVAAALNRADGRQFLQQGRIDRRAALPFQADAARRGQVENDPVGGRVAVAVGRITRDALPAQGAGHRRGKIGGAGAVVDGVQKGVVGVKQEQLVAVVGQSQLAGRPNEVAAHVGHVRVAVLDFVVGITAVQAAKTNGRLGYHDNLLRRNRRPLREAQHAFLAAARLLVAHLDVG